jgi:hypothetical protein
MKKHLQGNKHHGPMPLDQRFWARVEKSDGCWLWIGADFKQGYGGISVYGRDMQLAHRVSWELTNGPIPEGMWVLHKCDVRRCVRPDHLYLGTVTENARDAVDRGRATHMVMTGEECPKAKLTEAQVEEIRRLYVAGLKVTYRELSKRYGVTPEQISNIVRGKNWRSGSSRSIKPCTGVTRSRTPKRPRAKLTPEQVLEIRRRFDRGEPQKTIAADYGVSRFAVSLIGRRLNWPSLEERP